MDGLAQLLAVLMAMLFVFLIAGLAIYVVSAVFLMKVLRRAEFKPPVAAWVPLWNTAAMLQIAGVARPWVWVGVVVSGSLVSGLLSDTGSSLVSLLAWVVSVVVLVVGVMLAVWIARGVQAGLGLDSAGGVVLAVLIPFAWIVWMGLRADKATYYDAEVAQSIGSTFPLSKYVASIGA